MTSHHHTNRFFSVQHNTKILYFFLLGIVVVGGIFWYVNRYIYHFNAAYPQLSAVMSAPTQVDMGTQPEFTVSLNLSGQKILAGDIYLTYDPALVSYYKEYAFASGVGNVDISGTPYFNQPLAEQIVPSSSTSTSQSLRTILVSSYSNPSNPDWTTNATITFKFKAKSAGTASIALGTSSKFAGLSGGNATFFDMPTALPQVVVNIASSGQTTPTPTTGTNSPTPTTGQLTPSPTISPTPSTLEDVTVELSTLFQGIVDYPKDTTKELEVKIILQSTDSTISESSSARFTAKGKGIWKGSADFTQLDTSKNYVIFIKGPKHLRKKVCDNYPTEPNPGEYHCGVGSITFVGGTNTFDFSKIILLAGDLPPQNGIVDAVDLTYVRQNFGKKESAVLQKGDLNYDGIVDTQDYALVLAALRFKFDEE